jgi:polyisoprenoid-binding protein YceI
MKRLLTNIRCLVRSFRLIFLLAAVGLSINIHAQTPRATSLSAIPTHSVAPVKYSVDANHSTVGFSVPILDGVSTVKGKFTDFSVDINFDETDVTKSSVTATIKATSIDTGVEARDKHLRTADFFEVEKYPEITFQSAKIERKGKGFTAIGTFTMHGVSKEISIPFTSTGKFYNPITKKNLMGFSAKLQLDRREYGMTWKHSAVPNWVGDLVTIELDILVRT